MDYIYDQTARGIAERSFGHSNVRHGGCGAVATFNALVTLGDHPDLEEIIREYRRRHGLRMFGWMGISLWSVAGYFRRAGFEVGLCADPKRFDEKIRAGDAGIVWYLWWNGKNMRHPIGAHFVHAAFRENQFRCYNLYHGQADTVSADSLHRLLKKEALCAVLLCIRKKED